MENLGEDVSPISELPDDCLKHIFSFLPILERLKVERVCKRWRVIGERGWNDIVGLTIDHKYSDNIIHLILKRCGRFLRKLSIHYSYKHNKCLLMVLRFCKLYQLEYFMIHCCTTSTNIEFLIRNLRRILERITKLVTLNILGGKFLDSTDFLNVLNPDTLQTLMFDNGEFYNLRLERLSINPDRFPNLRVLNLLSMEILDNKMEKKERSLKELIKLELCNCAVPESFIQRLKTFSNLEKLDLRNQSDLICPLTNQDMADISRHCNKIREMILVELEDLTDDCFQYLGKMPSLEVLQLEFFVNGNMPNFMHLTNVRHLKFWFHYNIRSKDSLIQLITESSNLESLSSAGDLVLIESIVSDIREIFHHGHRQKPFHLVMAVGNNYLSNLRDICDHPLLKISYIQPGQYYP